MIQEINNTKDLGKRNLLLNVVNEYNLDFADISKAVEIDDLADLYIQQGAIPPNKRADALHIAVSVVNQIDYLVSWNYKHLANVNRERKIIALNYQQNYIHPLRILTPIELIDDED